jgi:hypothetical protein
VNIGGEEKSEEPVPEKPTAHISLLRFSDGKNLHLSANEKIIIVGANNSGKSQALREISEHLQREKAQEGIVVKHVELAKTGGNADFRNYVTSVAKRANDSYTVGDWQIGAHALDFWSRTGLIGGLSKGYLKLIDAAERLNICKHQENIAHDQTPSKPQQILYRSRALTESISSIFRKAFGKDLFINYRGGANIPIHVGIQPDLALDPFSDAFIAHVISQPLLEKQGDGMKSYAGILFETIVSPKDITLLDEPEAFLHPPQMRKLGETLAEHVKSQIIVATHSSDIMRGFLEALKGHVRVLRIRREGNINHLYEATPQAIRELWERPALRYSNALEGIFHEETIICEDESDCRIINAVADHMSVAEPGAWKDTAYVPAGGKHGIPKIAKTLREVGVPVKAIFDADALSEKGLLEEIVQSFGGDWKHYEPDWNQLDAALRSKHKMADADEIKRHIIKILEESEAGFIPKKNIEEALRSKNHWSSVKQDGGQGLPKGEIRLVWHRLINGLASIGIYIVPVGEMEGFLPHVGLHGPAHVTKVLESCDLAADDVGALREFVLRVHQGRSGIFP